MFELALMHLGSLALKLFHLCIILKSVFPLAFTIYQISMPILKALYLPSLWPLWANTACVHAVHVSMCMAVHCVHVIMCVWQRVCSEGAAGPWVSLQTVQHVLSLTNTLRGFTKLSSYSWDADTSCALHRFAGHILIPASETMSTLLLALCNCKKKPWSKPFFNNQKLTVIQETLIWISTVWKHQTVMFPLLLYDVMWLNLVWNLLIYVSLIGRTPHSATPDRRCEPLIKVHTPPSEHRACAGSLLMLCGQDLSHWEFQDSRGSCCSSLIC